MLCLQQVRVVQRNLVYAVGMPLGLCREEVSSTAAARSGFQACSSIASMHSLLWQGHQGPPLHVVKPVVEAAGGAWSPEAPPAVAASAVAVAHTPPCTGAGRPQPFWGVWAHQEGMIKIRTTALPDRAPGTARLGHARPCSRRHDPSVLPPALRVLPRCVLRRCRSTAARRSTQQQPRTARLAVRM